MAYGPGFGKCRRIILEPGVAEWRLSTQPGGCSEASRNLCDSVERENKDWRQFT